MPQQHLQQGQQRDAVDRGERRSGNGVDQLQRTLLPVIPFPRGLPGPEEVPCRTDCWPGSAQC